MEISCPNHSQFKVNPDFRKHARLLVAASGRVARGEMTKAAFSELETALGFRCNPDGLTVSPGLEFCMKLPSCINYDWVHSALQGGVLNCEVEALLAATKVPREELHSFLGNDAWQYPGAGAAKARRLFRVFDVRRVSEDNPSKLKATCSEMLGLHGLLRVFFTMKFTGVAAFEPHLASLNAICKVMDLILAFKRGIRSISEAAVAELKRAMSEHLAGHTRLYGTQWIRPKHHWLLDTAEQMLRDQMVIDAFVIERGHLLVKGVAEDTKNTVAYERSVMSGVLAKILHADPAEFGDRLVGRRCRLPGSVGVEVADKAVANGVEYRVGDVVFNGLAGGLLKACASEAGHHVFLVQPLRRVEAITEQAGIYTLQRGLVAWSAGDARHTLVWRVRSGGDLFVVTQ